MKNIILDEVIAKREPIFSTLREDIKFLEKAIKTLESCKLEAGRPVERELAQEWDLVAPLISRITRRKENLEHILKAEG